MTAPSRPQAEPYLPSSKRRGHPVRFASQTSRRIHGPLLHTVSWVLCPPTPVGAPSDPRAEHCLHPQTGRFLSRRRPQGKASPPLDGLLGQEGSISWPQGGTAPP